MKYIFNSKNFSLLLTLFFCVLLASCGGGGGGGSTGSSSGNSGGTGSGTGGGSSGGGNTTRTGSNVVPVSIDGNIFQIPDEPFITLTICSTKSSTKCMTVDHILVDTGSVGLRIFATPNTTPALSTLGLAAAPVTTPGSQTGECLQFVQGNTWGPVMLANLTMGGESASNVAFQVIHDTSFAPAPAACVNSNPGGLMNTPGAFGANGVLGIGLFLQDCGDACTQAGAGIYYSCVAGVCTDIGMPLISQVQNPVSTLSKDNNGVILSFNPVAGSGAASAIGTLTFGIDTESNNASLYANTILMDAYGDFKTFFEGQTYTSSYIDSGSNGLFFNAPNSIPECSSNNGFYCPSSVQDLTAQIYFQPNGTSSVSVAFSVGNADALFNSGNYVLNNVAGTATDVPGQGKTFDWGLPFFFGKDVYVVIEGNQPNSKSATGPYIGF